MRQNKNPRDACNIRGRERTVKEFAMDNFKGFAGNAPRMKVSHKDAICVYDECGSAPEPELAAPLCMDHAKRLTVQVMLLTSNKVSHIKKHMSNKIAPAHEPVKTEREVRSGLVYFIRFADRIKIGFTSDLEQRMKTLPHDEILALVPGTMSTERQYHNMFKDLRMNGEWFASHRKLLDYIGTLPKHELLAA